MFGCSFAEIFVLAQDTLKSSGVYTLLSDEVVGDFVLHAITGKARSSSTCVLLSSALRFDCTGVSVIETLDPNVIQSLCPPYSSTFLLLTNARFSTSVDRQMLTDIISKAMAQVIVITVDPSIARGREKIQLTENGFVAGIRRLYRPSMELSPVPADWPHHVLLASEALAMLNYNISSDFTEFRRSIEGLKSVSISVGGDIIDLARDDQLAHFLLAMTAGQKASSRPSSCRTVGNVVMGSDVHIRPGSMITGPAIIASNTFIGSQAVIADSVIEPAARVGDREILHDQFRRKNKTVDIRSGALPYKTAPFRTFGLFSYPRLVKRTADILASAAVLILFAPVILVVSAIVRLTSKGPAFFGDRRQGLHGRDFYCYKFRSMIVGADRLQRKLRTLNEVDGPQFKMEDDPRVTTIGRFLRNTYLDELPQFWNVLMGRMSIVGPRPSPEAENSQCPGWRDARLSVRPGITGLWQVCRTRMPGVDFQEWVYYDKLYASRISPGLDLWICWRTALYICKAFLKQF